MDSENWRFLYAKTTMKNALTKTKSTNPKETAYIIVEGKDYSDCLRIAMNNAHFKEKQLIGSRKLN